ncbi:MAG: hypothetical protein ACFFDX_09555 [Candidatus Odinarchaeota archaeon]
MKGLKKFTLLNLILLISMLGLISQLNFSNAQGNEGQLSFEKKFQFFEFTEKAGEIINTSYIDIPLPSSTWNLTDIELNFTDIKLEREIKVIEDQEYGSNYLYHSNKNFKRLGLAVQISLPESTKIYGFYIKGRNSSLLKENIRVQIRGYNEAEHRPNETLYGDVPLNMSSDPHWYYQDFSSLDLTLPKGNYSLVLNGSAIISTTSRFYWYINEIYPLIPYLYTSDYYNSWSLGAINSTFLYKINQKVERAFSPEELNMTVGLNTDKFLVPPSGNLRIENLNYFPDSENLEIPIIINQTINLIFNLSYHIDLKNEFATEPGQGSVLIKEGDESIWTISPTFNKVYTNYSVMFYYPSNWDNLTIFRNDINITSLIYFNSTEKSILFKSNVIIDGAGWEIKANSPNVPFNLNIPLIEYGPGQELRFSIQAPVMPGNYTFLLFAPDYYEIVNARQSLSLPSEENIFNYTFSTHPLEGEYYAYIYFFDGINAGIETVTFIMTIPFTIDPLTLFLIILASVIGISLTLSIVVVAKKHKRKIDTYKEEIFNKCMDILNLNYIMVSEKKSSLNVYEQVFIKQKLDPTLISGFLSAIHSFGIELTNSDEKTQTIKLEYKNLKVLMSEFKDFRIIIIMNELPSQKFLDSINNLALDIETQYSRYLETFRGNIEPFKGIENLLKKHLNTSFLYPLKIVKTGKTKISQTEKMMIGRALESMKKNNQKYFYITHIMEIKACDSKDIEAIFNLLDKNIFQPVI